MRGVWRPSGDPCSNLVHVGRRGTGVFRRLYMGLRLWLGPGLGRDLCSLG